MNAATAFALHPQLDVDHFCRITGLSRRSYYAYKKKVQSSSALQIEQVQSGEPRHDSAPALHIYDIPAPTALVKSAPTALSAKPRKSSALHNTAPAVNSVVQNPRRQKAILYGVFGAATLASVHNMLAVMTEITMDEVSAWSLTAVFAGTAVAFTLAGLKQRYTFALIVALVVFEAFCNAVNIYAGLYDFTTHTGSHFLRKVQSFVWFLSLQHCATSLALFSALCIAGVQYSAIREINSR